MIPLVPRVVLGAALTGVMLLVGTSTYVYLGSRQSKVAVAVQKPTVAPPRPQALVLPGTLYLAQQGAIYSLSAGRFHQLTPEAGWSMPSLYPDGSYLIAVRTSSYWSDVFVLNRFGTPVRQVTSNQSRYGMQDPSLNHWSFYPRLGPDGATLWMTYDGLKCDGCYDVSPAIYSMPFGGTVRQARAWTDGGDHTGGDQQPLPLAGGAVIYTKYSLGDDGQIVGQLWYTSRAGSFGRALTGPSVDCRDPSLSPDGGSIAMVCTYETQLAYLTIASWNGSSLGTLKTVVSDQLVAQPTWAPDGSGIAYLAPGIPGGQFQLWWLPKGAYTPPPAPPPPTPTPGGPYRGPLPSPSPPPPPPVVKAIQVTTNNGFDATSPMAWLG